MSRKGKKGSTSLSFMIPSFGLAIAGAAVLYRKEILTDPVAAWVAAISAAAFLTYGYDKAVAGSKWTRVPERVLLALAFTGGTLGAIAGMVLFRHKTSKKSFRKRFWLIVILQILLLFAYWKWGRAFVGSF